MNGPPFHKDGIRSIFSRMAAGRGRPAPLVRKLAWVGELDPGVAVELAQAGWQVVRLSAGDDAVAAVGRSGAAVVVVDCGAGDDERVARIEAMINAHPALQWVAVAAMDALSRPRACELIHDQCFDFFILPLRTAKLVASLGHAWGKTQLLPSARQAKAAPDSDLGLAGVSAVMAAVRERLCKFAGFDMPVLLTGETGTGKDVAARAIHARSIRHAGPFVAINCGALPENLVQSELFGHERGAFTGANVRKIGRIEAAAGGVVFLDEIGDLPLEAQCNLLRFLEAHTIERVGSTQSIRVDARVIAATHVDLQRAVREGRFREDLFYRLNVLHVQLPPLRERDGDAALLAQHFLDEFGATHTVRGRKFSAAAREAIVAYAWPGNVRELINRVHSAAVTASGRLLGPADLGLAADAAAAPDLQAAREQTDRETIVDQLRASGFNMSECARRLHISRVTLYRLCRKYGLKTDSAV
jgi:DNA-binding NtrC family response regulator